MSLPPPIEVVGDLSDLPKSTSGPRHVVWWGNVGFMVIEGTAFLLAGGCYLYLRSGSSQWPQLGAALPGLLWSTIFTAGMLLSQIPNLWMFAKARAKSTWGVRAGGVMITLAGLALTAIRWFEFQHLNAPWYDSAYGSVIWMLLVLHTSHLVTDIGETVVQTVWLFTHKIGDDQFSDVEDNATYWTFVVVAWLPIYGLIYWLPRLT